ncbi:serine/threonine-protein kinase [Fontimonas sp. SYSU GA230001]|uniref:serine/threonine-protein kinase n=1 Tax=Fontimonas sp. SYSU GA230001 TaxID=3142450 RepID=UPI0032B5BFE0
MLTAGTSFSHYRIIRPLGSGGMADVYEAEDAKLGRRVALKILPPELGRQPEFVRRFQKEVRAAASLNHPGIVTVFEVGESEGLPFYAMQLLGGGDLCSRIKRGVRPAEALAIAREIAEAFDHAHSRGFVHRDVKPANVMFDERGHAVLTDFGIVKGTAGETRLTAAGAAIGTPHYMSPEQARGQAVDARTDLYSLGVVLFEMLEGHVPYDAPEAISVIFRQISEPVPRLSAGNARYQTLIDTLMAKTPADRPSSAKVLIDLLDRYALEGAAQPAATAGPDRPGAADTAAPTRFEDRSRRRLSSGQRLLLLGSLGTVCLWVAATVIGPHETGPPRRAAALPATDGDSAGPPERTATAETRLAPLVAPVAVRSDEAQRASPPGDTASDNITRSANTPSERVEPIRLVRQNDPAGQRTSTPKPESASKAIDPRCDELLLLFGLGQPLTDSQTREIEQNCR